MDKKLIELMNWFNDKKNVLVSLSGGVDSALVAYAAFQALGKKSLAVTADYKTLSKEELDTSKNIADEIGIKQSSAQITHYYNEENLKGKQVIGVCNFPEKNIAGVVSQVLILGSIDKEGKVILVHPSQKSENGLPIA